MNRRWAFVSRRTPLICTILWKRRNKDSCDSPSRIDTSNDRIPSFHSVWLCGSNRYSTLAYHREVQNVPRCFVTRGTDSGIHLPSPLITIAIVIIWTTALLFPSSSALRTALGLIGKPLGMEELLLASAESEGSPTIGTLDRLVLKTHWMISSLRNFSWSSGHPILDITLRGF